MVAIWIAPGEGVSSVTKPPAVMGAGPADDDGGVR